MLTRRRNQLIEVLNAAALELINEATMRSPEDAASLTELATRIDEMRVDLISEQAKGLEIDHWPLRTAA